jgi:SAM-dependent methyltransferase
VIWSGLRDAVTATGAVGLVVDAGGGTGGFAVPLAEDGYRVVVVDPSPDSLASLARRATEQGVADLVEARQGDLGDLGEVVGEGTADVLLCHAVLDVVDDPRRALTAALRVLRPAGLLSLVVDGWVAAVLAQAAAGRFEEALAVLTQDDLDAAATDGRALFQASSAVRRGGATSRNRFDAASTVRLVEDAGADVVAVHGVRVFADIVPERLATDPFAAGRLLELELAASTSPALRDVATQLHVLARRRR